MQPITDQIPFDPGKDHLNPEMMISQKTAQPHHLYEGHRAAHAQKIKRETLPAGYSSPPYYPTPKGGWVSSWEDAYAKAYQVVSKMTLAEKVNLTTGTGLYMGPCVGNTGSAERFGIPNLCLEDSALGVALTDNTTAFPAGITVGATWNMDLAYARGYALGQESRGKGVNIQLGPTVGPLGREPRGGRNWEGFGADPVLQALGSANTIKGMQDNGVIATVKHFVAYEQEIDRMDEIPHGISRAYSSNVDDRTLHEIYAWPFAEAIRAGVGAIMTAYNEINGSAASQNSKLINGILKDEMGFQGIVMTDWLAQISGVASALSGLDMSMPGDGDIPLLGLSYWAYDLSTAILNGSVPVDRLNDMATRIVATWYQMGQDKDYPLPNFSSNTDDATGPCYPAAVISPTCVTNQYVNVQADHYKIVRNISREAVTMLKNEDETLPLGRNASLYVFGTDAQAQSDPNSCSYRACDDGTLGMGWGSGSTNYPYLNDPITAIRNATSSVEFYNSDTFPSDISPTASDIAIVFINSDSGEDTNEVDGNPGDREASGLVPWHNGDQLVQDAAAAFSTVIVVVHTVGPIIIEPWINLDSVKSVLFAHLPGQEAGYSLTDILFGAFSPSGHLPYTIPISEDDYPSSVSLQGTGIYIGQLQIDYTEGIYLDYRYFNKHNVTPRYPFGHGLSYTSFNFSDVALTPVTSLSSLPPARSPKGPTIESMYNNTIPPASQAAYPTSNFTYIDRYLYPYLDDPYSIEVSSDYPYPVGYQTTPQPDPPAGGSQGGNPALWDIMFNITLTVTNTGDTYAGKSVSMVFVEYPQGPSTNSSSSTTSGPYSNSSSLPSSNSSSYYDTPPLQLRTFAKTQTLAPGQSETLTLSLTRKDLSVWDTTLQNWVIPGVHEVNTTSTSQSTSSASYSASSSSSSSTLTTSLSQSTTTSTVTAVSNTIIPSSGAPTRTSRITITTTPESCKCTSSTGSGSGGSGFFRPSQPPSSSSSSTTTSNISSPLSQSPTSTTTTTTSSPTTTTTTTPSQTSTTSKAPFKFWLGQSLGDLGWVCDGQTGTCLEGVSPPVVQFPLSS